MKRKLRTIVILTALFFSGFELTAQDVGMNLGDPVSGLSYVDVVKDTRGFQNPTNSSLEVPLDNNGWPRADFSLTCFDLRNTRGNGQDVTEENPNPDPAEDPNPPKLDVEGIYRASFKGKAKKIKMKASQAVILDTLYNEATNTTTFKVDYKPRDEGRPFFAIEMTGTQRNNNAPLNSGITDLKIHRPGYPLNTNKLFTDEWIGFVAPFDTYRFMDWSHTNNNAKFVVPRNKGVQPTGPLEVSWNERLTTRQNDATTGKNPVDALGKTTRGMPWENIAEFIKITGKDAWINIPVHANNNYVRELARLLKRKIPQQTTLYLEYSNEIWNFTFSQTAWNFQKAKEDVSNGIGNLDYDDGVLLDGDSNDNLWAARRFARRTVEIGQIFKQEGLGEIGGRIRPVLAFYSSRPAFDAAGGKLNATRAMLNYIKDNFGPPKEYISSIATTGYFGGPDFVVLEEGASVNEILNAYNAGIPRYDEFADLAEEYEVDYDAYEGAPGFRPNFTTNLENRIRAERNRRMGDLLKRNIVDGFFSNGGRKFMYFASHKFYNRSGFWGTTDIVTDKNRDFKYRALLDVIAGNVDKKPILIKDSLNIGFQGKTYDSEIVVFGGDLPVNLSKTSGSLPRGLSFSDGRIIGVPTEEGKFNFRITATDANGDTDVRDATITISRTFDIPFIGTAPEIDGRQDDIWNGIGSRTLNRVIRPSNDAVVSPSDLDVTFKTAWDENALYFLVDVVDDVLIKDSDAPFNDDGIEIYLDPGNEKSDTYDLLDRQLIFRYNDPVNRANSTLPAGLRREEVETEKGYRMEIAIPWSGIGINGPSNGDLFGFDVHAADDDDGGARDNKKSFNSVNDLAFRNTTVFATGKFTGGSGGPVVETAEYYVIRNKKSGKYLRPENGNGKSKIIAANRRPNDWFKWEKVPTTNGFFYLKNKQTGLHFRPVSKREGAQMETLTSDARGTRTQWKTIPIAGDNFFFLKNRRTGKILHTTTNRSGGDVVQKSTSFTRDRGRFRLQPVNSGQTAAAPQVTTVQTAEVSTSAIAKAFPNPMLNELTIINVEKSEFYRITNIQTGRTVSSGTLSGSDLETIDVSNLSKGLFLLEYGTQKIKLVK